MAYRYAGVPDRRLYGAGRMHHRCFAGQAAGLNSFRLGAIFIKAPLPSQQRHDGELSLQEMNLFKTRVRYRFYTHRLASTHMFNVLTRLILLVVMWPVRLQINQECVQMNAQIYTSSL